LHKSVVCCGYSPRWESLPWMGGEPLISLRWFARSSTTNEIAFHNENG
jgi:hypothetical protein